MKLSKIVENMIKNGRISQIINNDDLEIDMSVSEAVTEACISLGLSTECFAPALQNDGGQTNIYLQ